MKTIQHFLLLSFIFYLVLLTHFSIAQEKDNKGIKNTTTKAKNPDSPQAAGDKIEFKSGSNAIITITDEGNNKGSITLPEMTTAPGDTDNKLYNDNGTLKFDGADIGSGASAIDGLTDGKYDGSSLFLGELSGNADDGSSNVNTGIGKHSLRLNTSGNNNTATGYFSLKANTTGNSNTANGANSLWSNTTGLSNTAIGSGALYSNTTGQSNTAVGQQIMALSNGSNNTAIGNFAGYFVEGGSNNTIIGTLAGRGTAAHSKSGSVFLGYKAGYNETNDNKLYIENSDATDPLIWGDFATDDVKINGDLEITTNTKTSTLQLTTGATNGHVLTSDATGNATWQATSSGASAIDGLTDGKYDGSSLFLGELSGNADDGSSNVNTGIGKHSLRLNTSGNNNTATGYFSLKANTTGNSNTANGANSLWSNTTGLSNTAIGSGALYSNTTGQSNTAVGQQIMALSNGSNNTAIGNFAGYFVEGGSNNTIIGTLAGRGTAAHSKSGSVFLGYKAGYNETNDNKLYIENSDATDPLIWGDFATDDVKINGDLEITTNTKTSTLQLTTGATNGHVLTSDATGNATWQAASSGGATEINDLIDGKTESSSLFLGTAAGSGYSGLNGNNTAVGYQAFQNGDGTDNTAIGWRALANASSTANSNTAVGKGASVNNTNGSSNVSVGDFANVANQLGSSNTIIGTEAGGTTTTHSKSGSVFLGYQAGYNETDDNRLYIENSNSSTPLIWGDFSNDLAAVHGKLGVDTKSATSKIDISGSNGYDQLRMRSSYTPTSSSDANGNTGDIAWDVNYMYIKTNAGWKRTSLSSF